MSDLKLCKNCKWCGGAWFVPQRLQYCFNPNVIESELRQNPGGDGKPFADNERTYGKDCGKEGKLYAT